MQIMFIIMLYMRFSKGFGIQKESGNFFNKHKSGTINHVIKQKRGNRKKIQPVLSVLALS